MTAILESIEKNMEIIALTDPREVMAAIQDDIILVVLDLEMPYLSGFEVLVKIREQFSREQLPVIVVSGLSDKKSHIRALKEGANDFVNKPFDEYELTLRISNQLNIMKAFRLQKRLNEELERRVKIRTHELEQATEFLINKMALVAEMHDETTGKHIIRVGKYSGLVSKKLGLPEKICYMIEKAAPLHDIGKLMIPGRILLKPGKLTKAEFSVMQGHVGKVRDLLEDHPSVMIQMAKSIAVNHHEKWDGSGYGRGLKDHSIPIEGRIVALADVFDALTTVRPYKDAWSVEDAVAYIKEQSGSHFDPELVDVLVNNIDGFVKIKNEYS